MFNYEDTLKILEDFSELKEKKRIKFLRNLLHEEEFVSWLFQPKQVANITEMVNALYVVLTKPKLIRSMSEMIIDTGYGEFDRSHATFLYSVCNIAIESNNSRIVEINRQKKEGELTNKEAASIMEQVDKYNKYIADLIKCTKKIVKSDAKKLAKESRLPKYICSIAYHSVPSPKYVDRFKIGYYLNNLLNGIYAEIEVMNEFDNSVRWRPFFKAIFGEKNIIEVATFILLEGVHRIDKYQSGSVKGCWDSLTDFALRELNEAPEALRGQMIELYIKRIDKMFSNKAFDLRVNLLAIDDDSFPKLSNTIQTYAEKIGNILSRGK